LYWFAQKLFYLFALETFGAINIMKGAILYADKITTVSQTDANKIRTTDHGCGLNDSLTYHAADLIGICNTIDGDAWSPKISHTSLAGKGKCKLVLQEKLAQMWIKTFC
jgi:starch synthase